MKKVNGREENLVIAHGKVVEEVSESRYVVLSEITPQRGYLLMFDLSISHILWPNFWVFPRAKRVLFLVEPKSVYPHQYWAIWRVFFGKSCSRHDEKVRWDPGYVFDDELSELTAYWGGTRIDKPSCVISNQLKFSPGANYVLRREVLSMLHDLPAGLDLAGRNWGRKDSRLSLLKELVWTLSAFKVPMFKNAIHYLRKPRGAKASPTGDAVDSTIAFLSNHEIAVVIENETGTYCSEKLSDAIRAGCKILYIGGELQDDFKKNYPVETISSLDQVPGSIVRLSAKDLPDRGNQIVITAAIAQLEAMSMRQMVSRTRLLLSEQN